jgi:hypothetical protein
MEGIPLPPPAGWAVGNQLKWIYSQFEKEIARDTIFNREQNGRSGVC